MVCEFKFVGYGHIKKDFALFVTKFKFDGPLKSKVSFLLEIFQFSSSKSKICFGSWTRSFKARGFICWNQTLELCPLRGALTKPYQKGGYYEKATLQKKSGTQ